MGQKLNYKTQVVDDRALVALKGSIDEDADFSEITSLDVKEYEFDFELVDKMNSCGIRGWISFLDNLEEGRKIIYKNCPQVVIEQISMVYGFVREGAQIESFYAPYFCSECDQEKKIKLQVKDIIDLHAPKIKCDKCDNEMEFDDIEAQYFSFMKR